MFWFNLPMGWGGGIYEAENLHIITSIYYEHFNGKLFHNNDTILDESSNFSIDNLLIFIFGLISVF